MSERIEDGINWVWYWYETEVEALEAFRNRCGRVAMDGDIVRPCVRECGSWTDKYYGFRVHK